AGDRRPALRGDPGLPAGLAADVSRSRRQAREVCGFEPLGGAGEEGEARPRPEPADENTPTPADEVGEAERRRPAGRAVERLPAKDREVVRLFYFEGLSYEEIAERLHTTVQAVGPRLTRLRRKLEGLLGEEG